MKTRLISSALSMALMGLSLATSAQAQNYTVKFGGAYLDPRASSSEFSGRLPSGSPAVPGVTLEVQPKSTVVFSIERHLSDRLGLELSLGIPPEH